MAITYKEEFNLNDLIFSDVINGLNEYFDEGETHKSFVEIKCYNEVLFYRFDAEMYLDKLIAWLRTEHGIFYYPGMEARYAKAEKRIPPFSERMKNDGALRTLKKLHKIVTDVEVSDKADSPTLIAAAIENDFAVLKQDLKNALEAKESFFETKGKLILKDLYRDILHKQPDGLSDEDIATKILDKMLEMKERLDHKEAEIENSDINKLIRDYCTKNDIIAPSPYFSDKACVEYLFSVVDLEREHRAAVGKQMVEDYEKDIMDHICQEASRNGFNLSKKVDGEPLTIECVFHDLLDLMRIRGEELRILKSRCNRLDEIVEELNALNDKIKE